MTTPSQRLRETLEHYALNPHLRGNIEAVLDELDGLRKLCSERLLSSFSEEERHILRTALLRQLFSGPVRDELIRKLAPKDELAVGDRVVTSDGYRGIVEQLSGPRAVSVRYHRGYVATEDPTTLTKELPWK